MTTDRPEPELGLSQALADATRTFFQPRSIDDTLTEVTHSVTTLIDAADCADVLIVTGKKTFDSKAPTSELPAQLDALQERLQEGPCVDAARRDILVRCDDFAIDPRWPRFGPQAAALGARSAVSFQLYVSNDTLGALNVFARTPNAFTTTDEELGTVLATHAAVALYAANKNEQFTSALATRDIIGQAKGMLIERYRIDSVQAFALLTKLSQDTNTPLATLAQELVKLGSDAPPRQ